jgi:hypothetical protein
VNRRVALAPAFALVALVAVAACGSAPAGPGDPDGLGRVSFALSVVPTGVGCIAVEIVPAAGSPLAREFSVVPGQAAAFELGDLPLGAAAVTVDAFDTACPVPAGTAPTWVSDPMAVTLAAGVPADVTVDLRRADGGGRVIVQTNFGDETGGSGTITVLDDAPIIDTLSVQPGTFVAACELATLTVNATDPNGDALTYAFRVASAPAGAAPSLLATDATATFRPDAAGEYALEVAVTDALGATARLDFRINAFGNGAAQPCR